MTKPRILHKVTFRSDEHSQNAEIESIRVDVETLPRFSRLVGKDLIPDVYGIEKQVIRRAPPNAQAYCIDRHPKLVGKMGKGKSLLEYFAINEVLGIRTGWAKLEDPDGPADETNIGEKDQSALRCYQGKIITFRRLGDGVNIYAATQDEIRKILGNMS